MYIRLSKTLTSLLLFLLIPMLGIAQNDQHRVRVKTIVTDFENTIRKGEQIHFVAIPSGTLFRAVSNQYGKFEIDLPYGSKYSIKIKSIGEAHDYTEIDIPPYSEKEAYAYMELTIQFEHPKLITLDNVYFDFAKSTLTKSSFEELNELVEFMKLKESLVIEIGGHTDHIGDDQANLELSQARANTVRRYLISKGISSRRIQAKGYGERAPIADNEIDQGRQKNRRTEVKILSE